MEKTKPRMSYESFRRQYHISLNEQQEAALRRVDGATLLLAVPGSGKTTVIISRTGYMVHCAGVPGDCILTLTFSLAAAKEMKERFRRKFGDMDRSPYFATIHSFCVSVIRHCQRRYGIDVPTLEPHSERIIRRAFQTATGQYPSDNAVKELAKDISCLAETGADLPALLQAYEEDKQARQLMDFDDQLIMAYALLREYPDALGFFQNQYAYVSIDEAQDTSKIQHAIIELLVKDKGNIFMVGDDDQSIYGFRGASPTSLLQFEHTYRDAQVLYMETNYRSDAAIVRQANQFIQDNNLRFRKNIVANTDAEGEIETVAIFDATEQYEKLYDMLLADYQAQHGTTAVLYRNNDSVLPLLELISQKHLPVRSRNESSVFFSNPTVADLLAFLSFAVNEDADSFLRIYYKLQLFINRAAAQQIVEEAVGSGASILDLLGALPQVQAKDKRWQSVRQAFQAIRRQTPEKAIDTILDRLDYQKQVDNSSEFSQQKVDILKQLGRSYKTIPDFLTRIEEWKLYDEKAFNDPRSNITLSTLHSAKGLEFDKVIMLDVADGILPSKSSLRDLGSALYEEEARLFYVGATRAKHKLIFLTAQNSFGKKVTPSRFVTRFLRTKAPAAKKADIAFTISSPEITRHHSKAPDVTITPGTIIRHKMFGVGTVIKADQNGVISIRFERGGVRKLLLQICLESSIIEILTT